MEWQQLEYFRAAAQEEHFTKAAERLSVSQPALSRSLAKLQRELGVDLFDRQGRTVRLNRYGRSFYARAARILQEMEEAKLELRQLQQTQFGEVSLAFLKSLGISFVPRLLGSFRERYPHVSFKLHQDSSSAMLEQLRRGEADFCLSAVTDTTPEIAWGSLWTEELFVFVHRAHPFSGRRSVEFEEIADEKFIALKPGFSSRALLDRLFLENGREPQVVFEGEETIGVLGFVAANLGIALLPRIDGVAMKDVAALSLADRSPHRTIGLAWRKDRTLTAAAALFRAHLVAFSQGTLSPSE
ncbi:LysR family transcriptional regulator [Cohnella sp. CIP 111063]|uniref:LysR substrate-binding domain-containing protein n=1 Tax=unclassified Cohnella TaxID=2636738 RepID=UPI000B9D3939|nr:MULTISPECIES: LysR substrate-binding domain-containing protein [unclassified Cohnella]OXS59300.1 LysR family transcriptional regulator [Cohnella sp. CIP 111063]PRX72324.1 DNA-binding transcriptional LysR family regulator [Cohnella sp. SGD-V74]